jgi:tetratricopeptide (TPR) repeat protein
MTLDGALDSPKEIVAERSPYRITADSHCDVGSLMMDLGDFRRAHKHLLRGLEILGKADDKDSMESRACLQLCLGRLFAKGTGTGKGFETEARLYLERSLYSFRKLLLATPSAKLDLQAAECKASLGLVLTCLDEKMFMQAEQLVSEAVETQEKHGDRLGLVETMNIYGLLLGRQRRVSEARHVFKENAAERREIYGTEFHPLLAESLVNVASIEPEPASAYQLYSEAVLILSTIFSGPGPDWADITKSNANELLLPLAPALDGQGVALVQMGRTGEALETFRRSLAIRRVALGDLHADTSSSLTHLAQTLIYSGKVSDPNHAQEARAALLEASNILRGLGKGRPSLEFAESVIRLANFELKGPIELRDDGNRDLSHLQTMLREVITLGDSKGDLGRSISLQAKELLREFGIH